LLLGEKYELGRVRKIGRRSGLRLETKVHITGLSWNDGPEWEVWRIGLKRKLGR
jgi:hypothetical protein